MSTIKNTLRPFYRAFSARFLEGAEWRRRAYAAPSPRRIKVQVLLRNGFPDATWIETGTFMGETTQLLSTVAKQVYSVEPEPGLHARAQKRFAQHNHVTILHGTSEAVFPTLLPTVSGAVNFWLDGHYSAGVTYKGERDTPVVEELLAIEANLSRFTKMCVLIDDLRCFHPSNPEHVHYPTLNHLVEWATRNQLIWHIEHDIFVAVKH